VYTIFYVPRLVRGIRGLRDEDFSFDLTARAKAASTWIQIRLFSRKKEYNYRI
jgi:hypothetical protein